MKSIDEAVELYSAADKYDIPDICSLCIDFMIKNCSPSTACTLFQAANLWGLDEVTSVCKRYFVQDLQNTLKAVPHEQLEPETINFIYSIEGLEEETEHFLIEYLNTYVHKVEASKPDIRTEVRDALQSIRFLTLDGPEELPLGLISEAEKKSVMSAIKDSNPDLLPNGFSKCTEVRYKKRMSLPSTFDYLPSYIRLW